jgi:hypothetical protein
MDSSWLIKGLVYLLIAVSLGVILWLIRRRPKRIIERRKVVRAKIAVKRRKVVMRKRVVKRRKLIKKRKPARQSRKRLKT